MKVPAPGVAVRPPEGRGKKEWEGRKVVGSLLAVGIWRVEIACRVLEGTAVCSAFPATVWCLSPRLQTLSHSGYWMFGRTRFHGLG
jgi:hypothetical protein